MNDFSAEPADTFAANFYEFYNLKNTIREKTSFKNPKSLYVLKMYYSKKKTSIIDYRKFKDFNNDSSIKYL